MCNEAWRCASRPQRGAGMSRPFAPETYNAGKTATKLLLSDLGGADAAETVTRVRRSQLFDYGNVAVDKYTPWDVMIDLERIAGTPHLTAAAARIQGYMLVQIEAPRHSSQLAVLMAEIGRDVGELFATASVALTHNKLTEGERLELLRELGELHRVTGEVISYLSREAQV